MERKRFNYKVFGQRNDGQTVETVFSTYWGPGREGDDAQAVESRDHAVREVANAACAQLTLQLRKQTGNAGLEVQPLSAELMDDAELTADTEPAAA